MHKKNIQIDPSLKPFVNYQTEEELNYYKNLTKEMQMVYSFIQFFYSQQIEELKSKNLVIQNQPHKYYINENQNNYSNSRENNEYKVKEKNNKENYSIKNHQKKLSTWPFFRNV